MSFNGLLIQVVLFSCLALLLRIRQITPGYAIAALLNLVILGLLFWFAPAISGWLSSSVWTATLLFPLIMSTRIRRLITREQYVDANRLVQRLSWLRWTGGYLQAPSLVKALALAQQHRPVQALELLGRDRATSGIIGQNANVIYYRITAQWPEFLAWVKLNFSEQAIFSTPSALGIAYIRALGELGKTEAMVQAFERFQQEGTLQRDRYSLNLLRMMVLAFCGRTQAVHQLFDSVLPSSEEAKAFWLATAQMAAPMSQHQDLGTQAAGQSAFEVQPNHAKKNQKQTRAWLKEQQTTANGLMAGAIRYRLRHPLSSVKLSQTELSTVNQLEREIKSESSAEPRPFSRQKGKSRLTWGFIGLNSFIFLSEFGAVLLGQGLNRLGWVTGNLELLPFADLGRLYSQTIFEAGALIPSEVLAGEWWRIVSAMFLHANLVHVFSNMLALFYYGAYVESRLGPWRFGLIYWISGLGSMLGMMGVAILQGQLNLAGVGASGAVMGTLGAMLALVLRRWRSSKSTPDGKTLRFLLTLVALQTVTDFLIPQVSASAHLSGLVIGFLLALVVARSPQPFSQPATPK